MLVAEADLQASAKLLKCRRVSDFHSKMNKQDMI